MLIALTGVCFRGSRFSNCHWYVSQIGCKMSVDKREAALNISMLFTLFYFCPSDRRLNNCVINELLR